jgi:hypothetical protein
MFWKAYWRSMLFQLPINFVRIFCHLLRICVELFTLPNFVLFKPVKAIISSIPFSAAILIRRSVLCTLRVTFSWFHTIFIVLRTVISAIIITYINRQYNCRIHSAPSPLLRYKLSITAAKKSHGTTNTDGSAVCLRYKLPHVAQRTWLGTRHPLNRLLRSYISSYSEVLYKRAVVSCSKQQTIKRYSTGERHGDQRRDRGVSFVAVRTKLWML